MMVLNQDEEQNIDNVFGEIASRVRRYRKEKGLNQTELAELLGITQAEISFYEAKKRKVSLSVLIKFCYIFGITPNELIQL